MAEQHLKEHKQEYMETTVFLLTFLPISTYHCLLAHFKKCFTQKGAIFYFGVNKMMV